MSSITHRLGTNQVFLQKLLEYVLSCSEKLYLADGGVIVLDWVLNETSPISTERRPTVIVLPGLVGDY